MTPSTKSLVALALSGDRPAFETLVSQYQGAVFAFVASRARNLDLAEEITQRAFVEAFICLKTLSEPEKFGSWTKGIALNVWKKSLSDRQVPTEDALLSRLIDQTDQPNPGIASAPDAPDLALEKQEFKDVIFREVGLLDENLSEVILLHYMEGLSYREIAATLSVPESTIVGRLQSARQKLKDQLMPYVEETLQERRPDVRQKVMALLPLALFTPTDWFGRLRSSLAPKSLGLGGLAVAGSVASFIGLATVVQHVSGEASSQPSQTVAMEFQKQPTQATAQGEGKSIPDQVAQPERTGDAEADAKPKLAVKLNKEGSEISLDYTVPSAGEISIELFNRLGQRVATPVEQRHQAGKYKVRVNTEGFDRGMYFIKLTKSDTTQVTRQFVISRGLPVGNLKAVRLLMNEAMTEHYENKNPKRAIEIYNRILSDHPNYPDRGAVHLASLYPHARVSSRAGILAAIDSTLAYDSSPKTRLEIARIIAGVWNDPKQALPMVNEALAQVDLALDPAASGDAAREPDAISEANMIRGALLLRQERDEEALSAYTVALQATRQMEDEPFVVYRRYDCYRELGLVQEKLGRPTEALASLEAALQVYESIDEKVRSRAYGIDAVRSALARLR